MNRISVIILAIIGTTIAAVTPAEAQICFGLGKFRIEQSDDRFSADGLTTVSGKNNRISKKSVNGGTHIGCDGMFVEPVAIKRQADGSIVGLSFYVHNDAFDDTAFGSTSIGTLRRIAFVTGEGQPISLPITDGGTRWGRITYNSASRSASSQVFETGIAELTPEQFRRIINATLLAVRIEGNGRTVTYEARDISKSFIPNLRTFYAAHLTQGAGQ
ncbi:MAG: hypothetical protein H6916_10865 [Novosphingobium sp.]|uniref:hypothetical protein n=1 Tax=Novosphingobium sp. TaxID=1874826 RepID=UPI001E19CDD1|nr:hypothetical protein [Novosphingobium sp.]MCB2058051.1 hypothetical protein [Novosphingobium sp.]MCP5387294.1 hypothetical protein [Novosphingobium sp.]